MAQNKNQHYVPKFYFRLFSKNQNSICSFNISNEKFIEHASIKSQCSKDYFYSKDKKIENTFSQLENLAKEKLDRIIKNKSLDCLSMEEIGRLKIVLKSNHTLLISMLAGILLYDLKIVLLENKSKIDFIFSD